jgi:hypothetical protein
MVCVSTALLHVESFRDILPRNYLQCFLAGHRTTKTRQKSAKFSWLGFWRVIPDEWVRCQVASEVGCVALARSARETALRLLYHVGEGRLRWGAQEPFGGQRRLRRLVGRERTQQVLCQQAKSVLLEVCKYVDVKTRGLVWQSSPSRKYQI